MEVMGNVLDNACKYCLEFVEVSVRQTTDSHLHILVEDDGPGIPQSQRGPCSIAASGRYAASRPGRGLSVAREIVEQYDGEIIAGESLLGGACMEVVFGRQQMEDKQS
jgi:two-component system sensor histidine kinase PhoQ